MASKRRKQILFFILDMKRIAVVEIGTNPLQICLPGVRQFPGGQHAVDESIQHIQDSALTGVVGVEIIHRIAKEIFRYGLNFEKRRNGRDRHVWPPLLPQRRRQRHAC